MLIFLKAIFNGLVVIFAFFDGADILRRICKDEVEIPQNSFMCGIISRCLGRWPNWLPKLYRGLYLFIFIYTFLEPFFDSITGKHNLKFVFPHIAAK